MIYLFLNRNNIKTLFVKKTFLKQEEIAFFEKDYHSELISINKPLNVDIIASALKESISALSSKNQRENRLFLILPQEFFYFFRTEVPFDIAKPAINSFITDKISTTLALLPEEIIFDYFIKETKTQKIINFFGLKKEKLDSLEKAAELIDLKIINVIPEPLVYYKLFEKTLKNDKQEVIFYAILEKGFIYGYVFDNFGLVDKTQFFETLNEEKNYLKTLRNIIGKIEERKIKLNRIILSGHQSDKIRQDTFTRDIGIWTNPLKRIVPNYYENYLKTLVVKNQEIFPILIYDVCFGAFIFSKEEKFSIFKNHQLSKKEIYRSKLKKSSKKEAFIFIISFLVSLGGFLVLSNINNLKNYRFSLFNNRQNEKVQAQMSPTPQPQLNSSTPQVTIKKEELKIQVLNGSGIPGKAGELRSILKEKGYSEVITGNADNFNYQNTEIKVKKSKSQALNQIKKDLGYYFSLLKESFLEEREIPDIIIIVGSDFK
ncbi:MAG: LytR C-terminal domain-containing protein [Patescibacteria group bacterium]|nr:LytR C-terminal domain-containing protein [Patescibacteria group bacterium]